MESQSYANHRRYYPLYHFVLLPLLTLNLIVRIVYAVRHAGARLNWWELVMAIALLLFALVARSMALRVQDRVIALEESLRLARCLPEDLRGRIGELRTSHLIALRFSDDAEVSDLARAVLIGEFSRAGDIKKRIKTWRPERRPRA
ncbi:MAG: DUF6526 family protein [Acidobacteriota bacterium]